jgi:hypothetical protein
MNAGGGPGANRTHIVNDNCFTDSLKDHFHLTHVSVLVKACALGTAQPPYSGPVWSVP